MTLMGGPIDTRRSPTSPRSGSPTEPIASLREVFRLAWSRPGDALQNFDHLPVCYLAEIVVKIADGAKDLVIFEADDDCLGAQFSINVPIALLTLGLAIWRVPESRDAPDDGTVDWRGAFLATLGLGDWPIV